jgi:hypothetical protein
MFRSIFAFLATQAVIITRTTGSPGEYPEPPPNYNATSEYRMMFPAAAEFDFCYNVCLAFSAARQGNGFDLCPPYQYSQSFYDPEMDELICRYLYWSVDENGTRGLVYERDPTTLTLEERANPLTHIEAEQVLYPPLDFDSLPANNLTRESFLAHLGGILFGQSQDIGEHELPPTNNLNMALHMLVNSAPVRRRLEGEISIESWGVWFLMNQFASNDTDVSAELVHQCEQGELRNVATVFSLLINQTEMLESFQTNLTRRVSCDRCEGSRVFESAGPIPVYSTASNGMTVGLVEILRAVLADSPIWDNFYCASCRDGQTLNFGPFSLNSISEILTFAFMRSYEGNVSLPLFLNPSEVFGETISPTGIYRLYAFASNDDSATMRINDEWFVSNNGTNLILTTPITEPVVSNSFNLVLYERV